MERAFSVPRTAGRSIKHARTNRRIACVARGRLRTSKACVKPVHRITTVLEITLKVTVLTTVRPKHTRRNSLTANARLVTPTRRGPASHVSSVWTAARTKTTRVRGSVRLVPYAPPQLHRFSTRKRPVCTPPTLSVTPVRPAVTGRLANTTFPKPART